MLYIAVRKGGGNNCTLSPPPFWKMCPCGWPIDGVTAVSCNRWIENEARIAAEISREPAENEPEDGTRSHYGDRRPAYAGWYPTLCVHMELIYCWILLYVLENRITDEMGPLKYVVVIWIFGVFSRAILYSFSRFHLYGFCRSKWLCRNIIC